MSFANGVSRFITGAASLGKRAMNSSAVAALGKAIANYGPGAVRYAAQMASPLIQQRIGEYVQDRQRKRQREMEQEDYLADELRRRQSNLVRNAQMTVMAQQQAQPMESLGLIDQGFATPYESADTYGYPDAAMGDSRNLTLRPTSNPLRQQNRGIRNNIRSVAIAPAPDGVPNSLVVSNRDPRGGHLQGYWRGQPNINPAALSLRTTEGSMVNQRSGYIVKGGRNTGFNEQTGQMVPRNWR